MEKRKAAWTEEQVMRTLEALQKNGMPAIYVVTKAEAVEKVAAMLREGEVISCGGSVTLVESGVRDLMKSGKYRFLDREQIPAEEVYQKTFAADVFLTSANAITEKGEIYQVDGNGNRVAAMIYGPKRVIVVAGCNKLVPDVPAAVERVKCVAAPLNAKRLHTGTPCEELGHCCAEGKDMTAGCRSERRMCCQYVVTGYQRTPRIRVILVGETLGY